MHQRWLLLPALAVAACGSPPAGAPSPSPRVSPAHTATPAPAPEILAVSVISTGVGVYQLATVPVAILHNDAESHGAAQVVVHFTTEGQGGRTLSGLDSVAVNLAPGETLPVAASCNHACQGAVATRADVSVGAWVTSPGVSFSAATAVYTCGTCGGGHGYGTVTGNLAVAHLGSGAAVAVFADCRNGSGSIVAAGVRQIVWPGGSTLSVDVPVIVDEPPAVCNLGASTGW